MTASFGADALFFLCVAGESPPDEAAAAQACLRH